MDFSDALRAVRDGKRSRRALWAGGLDGKVGAWMELAQVDGLGDVLICPAPGAGKNAVLFACSQWDILADDWEILP